MAIQDQINKVKWSADNFLKAVQNAVSEMSTGDKPRGKELKDFLFSVGQAAIGLVNNKIKTDDHYYFGRMNKDQSPEAATQEVVDNAMYTYNQPEVDHLMRLLIEAMAVASRRLSILDAGILVKHYIDTMPMKKIEEEKKRIDWWKNNANYFRR